MRGPDLVCGREARATLQLDDAERQSVQLVELRRPRLQLARELGRVEHVDDLRLAQLGIVHELGELVLDEVDPPVQRHDDRNHGRGGKIP